MQAQIADFDDCVETATQSIACPNGRGDCPGVVPELEDIDLVTQCPDCCEKSLFPDGVPEEVADNV